MDLPSLLYCRICGDVIETYKYLHGVYNINSSSLLPLSVGDSGVNTRGHCSNVLGYRIVNLWNSLPEDIVSAPTVNCLKGRFDRHCSHLRFSYNCDDFNF